MKAYAKKTFPWFLFHYKNYSLISETEKRMTFVMQWWLQLERGKRRTTCIQLNEVAPVRIFFFQFLHGALVGNVKLVIPVCDQLLQRLTYFCSRGRQVFQKEVKPPARRLMCY